MRTITTYLTITLLTISGVVASAQNNPALFPGTASQTDTVTVTVDVPAPAPGEIPEDFMTPVGSFAQGLGAPCDTIDVGDGRLQIVLKDDHTWYYIKNLEKISQDSVFTEYWTVNSTNPYDISIAQLPTHNSIALVDSASVFVCPYQTAVFSKFGYRHGRRHQGVDLPLKTGDPVVAVRRARARIHLCVRIRKSCDHTP